MKFSLQSCVTECTFSYGSDTVVKFQCAIETASIKGILFNCRYLLGNFNGSDHIDHSGKG